MNDRLLKPRDFQEAGNWMSINKGQTEFASHNKLITFQPFALEKYMEIFIGALDFLSSYDKKKVINHLQPWVVEINWDGQ